MTSDLTKSASLGASLCIGVALETRAVPAVGVDTVDVSVAMKTIGAAVTRGAHPLTTQDFSSSGDEESSMRLFSSWGGSFLSPCVHTPLSLTECSCWCVCSSRPSSLLAAPPTVLSFVSSRTNRADILSTILASCCTLSLTSTTVTCTT